MVDVSAKAVTPRRALATGEIILSSSIIEMIKNKKMPKGDPLSIAEVAGINGVKKTSELIPLCHPLSLDHISIHSEINESKNSVIVYSKIVEPNLKIQNTKLLIKSGGKRGLWINPDGVPEKIKSVLSL